MLTKLWDEITESQIWTSVFRHGKPDNPRNQALAVLSNVFLHLHPARARKGGVKLQYTWCMGGVSFFLFLELTITGILLIIRASHEPSAPPAPTPSTGWSAAPTTATP